MNLFFSRIVTEKPALARRAPVATPPTPAPGWSLEMFEYGVWGVVTDYNGCLLLLFSSHYADKSDAVPAQCKTVWENEWCFHMTMYVA